MKEEDNQIKFFAKLDAAQDEKEAAPSGGGYFFGLFDRVFRTEASNPGISTIAVEPAAPQESRLAPERENTNSPASSQHSNGKLSTFLKPKASLQLKNYNDSAFKQYWMPDSTGRECYQCEERFTTFRRKHHCRLCGQIFCAKCCGNRVDGASLGYMGELRLCDFCAAKVHQKTNEVEMSKQQKDLPHSSASRKTSDHSRPNVVESVCTVSNGTIWSLCPGANDEQMEEHRYQNTEKSSNAPAMLSVQDLYMGRQESSFLTRDSTIHSVVPEEDDSGPDWFRSMDPGMDGVITNDTSDSGDMFAYANLTTTSRELPKDISTTSRNSRASDVERKITFPSKGFDSTDEQDAMNANLKELFLKNSERMLDDVLKREGVDPARWRQTILQISQSIAEKIRVSAAQGDAMNSAAYVHIKKLLVAEKVPNAEVVWGVVCGKSMLHEKMIAAEQATEESVMIISGSIEYERVANKMSSIEPLMVQEEKFLEKQVERIISRRASLILVEGGVSRLAAQMLQNEGIRVAVNVKINSLQRVSRSTGADIVSSSDAQLVEQCLGHCPRFSQRCVVLKDGSEKNLLVFSDCEKELGCSVLLSSDSEVELLSVKRILQFFITTFYSNRLERSYLSAFNARLTYSISDCGVCESRRYVLDQMPKTPFESALVSTCLGASPFIEFEPPFLETAPGKDCPLLAYFKQPLYRLATTNDNDTSSCNSSEINETDDNDVELPPRHPFGSSTRGATLAKATIAFRALSGLAFRRRAKVLVQVHKKSRTPKLKNQYKAKDVMDPRLHQRIAVLFGSFSRKSPNAPYFCVRPWVVSMQYYGDHDMTLGEFLSKYCFNRNYECPSQNCEVSMLEHSRKLVFARVCIEITVQQLSDAERLLDASEPQKEIIAWQNCALCNFSSKLVKITHNLSQLSFARFLDYMGNSCSATDGTSSSPQKSECRHCFFHEKTHFFVWDNLVASFKATAIKPHKVVFSPIVCNIKLLTSLKKALVVDINRISELALSICENANMQLANMDDMESNLVAIRLSQFIKSTMKSAGESRAFAKQLIGEESDVISSNDEQYIQATEVFMKMRESAFALISQWNENFALASKSVRADDGTYLETIAAKLEKIENPFPSYLHLSIPLQPRIGVVVRDIQDSLKNYHPDIGSIIAYALSAAEYEDESILDMTDSNYGTDKNESTAQNDALKSTHHLDIEFEDDSASYFVKIFYAKQFCKLRELLFSGGEESFIRSLSQTTFWTPQGGKSGSFFYRTLDDRFVVKQMSRFEIQSFVKFAPNYFDYITTAATENKLTTLCKVYGVFRVGYKSKTTQLKVDILVMEYLFYNHNVSQVWDLKGSLRNRLASAGKTSSDLVLLDENFVKDLWNQQLYILPHSKAALNQAISNDSHFLSSQHVMDYSLLVGVDDENGELILGIVDYMRTYTLDKKLESWVKIVAIPGGHLPTILSPEMYCARFSEAIDSYFPVVPDQWTGLGTVSSY